jgi:hypothetical protein
MLPCSAGFADATTDNIPSHEDRIRDSICLSRYGSDVDSERAVFHLRSGQSNGMVGRVSDNRWRWYWTGSEPG